MKHQGWRTEICGDGDKAVDEFVRLRPDMVIMSLDLPSMDGHIAALEMRETDYSARITIVTSRTGKEKAEDAAYSTGAVGVLVTPLTQSVFDEQWDSMMGDIPEAPGLSDLDELYPEAEESEMPLLPPMPPMMAPVPEAVEMPGLASPQPEPEEPPKKKRKWLRRIVLLVVISGVAAAGAHYAGLVNLSDYFAALEPYFP
jgi:CheY-like chemotaxis protein